MFCTENLNEIIKNRLFSRGAALVSCADLTMLPEKQRQGLPHGVSIAVRIPRDVVRRINESPTPEYHAQYDLLNQKLDTLASECEKLLVDAGFAAVAQSRAYVSRFETDYETLLPHKTVATRAGLGWIGKCALLVTREYGSAVRLTSVLTDAPLKTEEPIDRSFCGSCEECKKACPGGAVLGKNWDINTYRDEFFDAKKCRETARKRSAESLGLEISLCGRCIAVCPYTKRYLGEK